MDKTISIALIIVVILIGLGVWGHEHHEGMMGTYAEKSEWGSQKGEEQKNMMEETGTKEGEWKESNEQQAKEANGGMMDGDHMQMGSGTMEHMMGAGSYETYSPEKIAKAATGKVVLFFHASWCPSCRAVDKDIRAHLGDIPKDVTILDVDYDNSADLKGKYGVTYQHTFVQVDKDGNMLNKWSGSPTLADLVHNIK